MLISALLIGADVSAKVVNYNSQYAGSGTVGTINSEPLTLQEARDIQILENDIRILDTEIKKCESSKKGWTAATVIGSAGVVATGIAAIVQGVKIKNTNDAIQEAKDKTTEYENKAKAIGGTH